MKNGVPGCSGTKDIGGGRIGGGIGIGIASGTAIGMGDSSGTGGGIGINMGTGGGIA